MKRMTMIKDALPLLQLNPTVRIILKRKNSAIGYEPVGAGDYEKIINKFGDLVLLETRIGDRSLKLIVK